MLCFGVLVKTVSSLTTNKRSEMVSILNITKSKQIGDICILDYSLRDEFKSLPTPPWLSEWDDLMPNTFCKDKYDIKTDTNYNELQIAKRLLFSLGSGFSVDSWHEAALRKRYTNSALEEMLDTLWRTGNIPQNNPTVEEIASERTYSPSLKKRTIAELYNPRWNYNTGNRVKIYVLRSIQRDLEAAGDQIMELKSSSICKTVDTIFGCLSWSGDTKRLRTKVGAAAIDSGIDNRSDQESISVVAQKALKDITLYTACLSNRADCKN